jgi:hypothetical protein
VKLEMGKRALEFCRANPDPSAGYTATVDELQQQINRAEQLVGMQRDGIIQVGTATGTKRGLRAAMIRVRFEDEPQRLAAWESASNVVAAPRPHTQLGPEPIRAPK